MKDLQRTGCVLGAAIALICSHPTFAAITPASLFTDNAVLQQKIAIPVWGTADPKEPIAVTINGETATTVSDNDGAWTVKLKPVPAGGPYSLKIAGRGSDLVTLNNIVVGEVWICSGQSNMEYPMQGWKQPAFTKDAIPTSADPMLRFAIVKHQIGMSAQSSVSTSWQVATVDTVPSVTAVGYFFARDLRKALGVPVGLIHDNWGGTPAQAWSSQEALQAVPSLHHYLDEQFTYPTSFPQQYLSYCEALARYNDDLVKFQASVDAAKAAGSAVPTNAPQAPREPADYEHWPNGATHLFNGMIAPIIPYGIRGAIWYQGESNGGQGYEYKTLFPTMIADWRARWGEGNFPFYFVQLAPFMKIADNPVPKGQNTWADVREAQRLTLTALPNTGMAVITDLGDVGDVHPRRKAPVGERLALIAKAKVYGIPVEYTGPVFTKAKRSGNKMIAKFSHADGLKAIEVHDVSSDGPVVATADKLVGFEVAGTDGVYYAADATIGHNCVIASSPNVPHPVAVRYGWANYPVANLSNGAGLPASPFKSDKWPWASGPKPMPAPPTK